MIDEAENWLRERGFPILRVRYHRGDLAQSRFRWTIYSALSMSRCKATYCPRFVSLASSLLRLTWKDFAPVV